MFEAYSIGIRVSLINGVTSGLIGLSRQFRGADQDAKGLQRTLDRIGKSAAIGAALTATGAAGLGLIGKATSAAKEYGSELSILNQLGMSQRDIAAGVGSAWKTVYDVPTSRIAENIKTLRELRSAFGSTSHQEAEARMILPLVQRVSGVLTALTGKEQTHVGFDLVKSAELRTIGALSPDKLMRNVELMSRTLIAMGGTITAQDFHGTLKMGKMATPRWSDDFTYLYLPTLMQELKTGKGGGAQSAGTILQSLYQQTHGRMTKAAMPLWVQAGLINERDVVKNATGQYQMKPGAVRGIETFEANPYAWVQNYLRPGVDKLMRERGVSAETAVNAMFSNRNAAFGAYTFLMKATQFERDRKLIEQSKNSEQAYRSLVKTNPMLAEQALQSQLHNQMVIFGYSILPDLLKVMGDLLPYMKNFTAWMREHPKLVGGAVKAFGLVSAALVAIGTATGVVVSFQALRMFMGLFTASGPIAANGPKIAGALRWVWTGVAGLAGALGWWTVPIVAALAAITGGLVFIGKGWDRNKSAVENVKDGLRDYWAWMERMGGRALGLIRRLENPGDKATPAAKATAFALKFADGFIVGFKGALAPYIAKAVLVWGALKKSWDPVVNGVLDGVTKFLGRMKALGALARNLMPWAFRADAAPSTGGGKPAGKGGLDWDVRRFGNIVGGNTVDAIVGFGLGRFGIPLGGGNRRALVPPARGGDVKQINTTVMMDGREVARAVSIHQERDMERASRAAGSGVDPRRALVPVGLGVA